MSVEELKIKLFNLINWVLVLIKECWILTPQNFNMIWNFDHFSKQNIEMVKFSHLKILYLFKNS
jgi:hypothetical protein